MKELTVLDAICSRRSIKTFSSKPIADTVLHALVEAGTEAPSSWNFQPWRIVLVRSEEQKKALAEVAWNQPQITQAPVTFVFAASKSGWEKTMRQTLDTAVAAGAWPQKAADFIAQNAPGFQRGLGERIREYVVKDCMIAATHVALAAESLGLGSCFMNGWIEDGVKKVIGADGDDDVVIALLLPVGYPDASHTPKHPGRLPLKWTVFSDSLREPYQFCPKALRSPREKAMGLVHLPRLIDKVRLHLRGELPGYNYLTSGFDKMLLELLNVSAAAFEALVSQHSDEGRLLEALRGMARSLSEQEKEEFNKKILSVGPSDEARSQRFRRLLDGVDPSRTDVRSFVDLIDLTEGRL